MKNNNESEIEKIIKAKIFIELLILTDSMFAKSDLPNRTAASLIYLNLVEYLLDFMARHIPSKKLNILRFGEISLGGKIKFLRKGNDFYKKRELIDNLNEIDSHRKKIIHKLIDSVYKQKIDKSIIKIKKLFDKFNKILIDISSHYNFVSQ